MELSTKAFRIIMLVICGGISVLDFVAYFDTNRIISLILAVIMLLCSGVWIAELVIDKKK